MTQAQIYTYARRLVGANSTDWPESDLVVDLNDALVDVWTRLKVARGVLEYDDTNYTDLPSSTFNLVASTAPYKITVDANSNEIITIHKVQVLDGSSAWVDVPRKRVGEGDQSVLIDATTASVPSFYYEMGASIVLSPIPSTSRTNGVKIWYDRAPSLFTVGGSITPGVPSPYHKLIADKAALNFAIIKGKNSAANIKTLVELGEQRLDQYEAHRRKDEVRRMVPAQSNTR